jgi:hypothetical protein
MEKGELRLTKCLKAERNERPPTETHCSTLGVEAVFQSRERGHLGKADEQGNDLLDIKYRHIMSCLTWESKT